MLEALQPLVHNTSWLAVAAERAVSRAMGANNLVKANALVLHAALIGLGIGLGQVVGAHRTADSVGDAAPHGACRQHLLQHHQRKHQGHARQGHDAQLANVPSFRNADQSGGRHGQAVGQR